VSAGGYYRWFYLNRAIDELVKACDSKAFSDKQWAWLLLTPRKRDADFLRMQVVLDRKKLWVRRIWIEELTGNTVSLDLDQPVVAVQPLTLAAISKGLPKDWKRVDVPLSIEGK